MKIAQNKLRPELRGVGGWLRFLVISMMVLSPLMEIGQYSDLYGKLPEVLRLPLGCLSAIFVFTLIWLGNQLRTVFEWRTVRVVVNALWILPIAFNLSVALIIYAYAHS